MATNGNALILSITGSYPVYPGHPLVVAATIMRLYESFDAANAPTGLGFSAAMGDNSVPGAGCHVGAAMWILKMGKDGMPPEDLIHAANDYWTRGQAGGHVKNVDAGMAQASAVESVFREQAATWFCR
jgi:hypothetical protein